MKYGDEIDTTILGEVIVESQCDAIIIFILLRTFFDCNYRIFYGNPSFEKHGLQRKSIADQSARVIRFSWAGRNVSTPGEMLRGSSSVLCFRVQITSRST